MFSNNNSTKPSRERHETVIQTARPIIMPDGTLETLKWFALFLMTVDHINTYLLDSRQPGMFAAGRIAMPLFGFVLAYNLTRPGALEQGAYRRTMLRLALVGLIATPPYVALADPGMRWWPLNIMFTLLASASLSYLIEKGGPGRIAAAVVLFVAAGALVDYHWYGLCFYLAAWLYCKRPSSASLAIWLIATAALYMVNRTGWAMLALPLIFALNGVPVYMPRVRYAFYVYYPLHLAALLVLDRYLPA